MLRLWFILVIRMTVYMDVIRGGRKVTFGLMSRLILGLILALVSVLMFMFGLL